MNAGTISIGSSTEQRVVISVSGDSGVTIHTDISPALARVYGAMLMAIADMLAPPSSPAPKE